MLCFFTALKQKLHFSMCCNNLFSLLGRHELEGVQCLCCSKKNQPFFSWKGFCHAEKAQVLKMPRCLNENKWNKCFYIDFCEPGCTLLSKNAEFNYYFCYPCVLFTFEVAARLFISVTEVIAEFRLFRAPRLCFG